jgi:hypothetical protein
MLSVLDDRGAGAEVAFRFNKLSRIKELTAGVTLVSTSIFIFTVRTNTMDETIS